MAAFWKLLVLVAVLLMPFGMQPVAAAPMQHHSSMPMQHCPDQGSKHDTALTQCAMACSAALPAEDAGNGHPPLIACAPTEAAAVDILHGLHPDTATPPPKPS